MTKIDATTYTLAKEVIAGKWGNDDERIRRLTEAGYDATHIQSVVNYLCSTSANAEIIPEELNTEENIKVIEIDANEYDALKIVLVM